MKPWRIFTPEPLAVRSVARSHVGRVRLINEDRVFDCPERGLWAVADGMGGHSGGDLAAQAVIDALRTLTEKGPAIDAPAMLEAIQHANAAIVRHNQMRSADAGSTVVAAQLADRVATVAWVGDSRGYLLRDGAIRQLTHDHSFVQDLIDAGLLTVTAAARHPRANVVTRALGVGASVEIATIKVEVRAGDCLLLCSDGLSRSLQEAGPAIAVGDIDAMAEGLMCDALHRDGSDNISLVCLQVN